MMSTRKKLTYTDRYFFIPMEDYKTIKNQYINICIYIVFTIFLFFLYTHHYNTEMVHLQRTVTEIKAAFLFFFKAFNNINCSTRSLRVRS